MRTGDVQAQKLRQPHTSRSRLGSLPVSAASAARGHGPGVRRVPVWWLPGPAVSSGAGASPMLRLPEPRGRRCRRCANTPGTGPEAAAAKTDSPEICWHGRSATEPGPTPVLLEPGPCPVLMATTAGCARGGSTTPPKHRVEPKLCLSPFPVADPDQHHDNHNRVQLWGSQTCPRVSGLSSHSQSCSILGPCSTMGTAEVPGAPGDQLRSPPCGAGLWLSRAPPTVTPISVLIIAKSCCSCTRSTAWLEERDSALGASVQLFWSRASGSVAAIPVVPVAG